MNLNLSNSIDIDFMLDMVGNSSNFEHQHEFPSKLVNPIEWAKSKGIKWNVLFGLRNMICVLQVPICCNKKMKLKTFINPIKNG